MSTFPGNPFVSEYVTSDADVEDEDVAQAVMALAYEQRTATMLQFLMWEPTRGVDSLGAELQKQIVQRLGLGD